VIIWPYVLIWRYPIPGPPRTSIIFGNFSEIVKLEPGEPFVIWSKKYDSPIIRYFFGPSMRVVVTNAELAKQVLQDEKTFTKNLRDYNFLSENLGYTLLTTSDIEFHRKQRSLCNPAFKYDSITNFIPMFVDQTKKLITKWKSKINKEEKNEVLIEVTQDLSALTLDIIGSGGFNCDFDSFENTSDNSLANAYHKLMKTFGISLLMVIPWYEKVPTEKRRLRAKQLKVINEAVIQIIKLRRKNPKIGVPDLLQMLLDAKDNVTGVMLSDQEIIDLCLTFLIAGHETTSMLLTWTLYAFAKYPEVERKCREEIRNVLGSNPPTKETLGELKYLSHTINEVLRLHSPVPLVKRMVEKRCNHGRLSYT